MTKLIFGLILIPLSFSNVFAWDIPLQVSDLIIGPYVAQNDASFKKVSVKAGEECLVYSDGTSAVVLEDRGEEVLIKLNASLVFQENFADEKGNRSKINLYKEHSRSDNDLCPRGTMVLINKRELRELHDIRSLYVEDYFRADRDATMVAERHSIGVPEQQKELILGYYTAQNSAQYQKNFVNAGEECAVLAKGSDLQVYSQGEGSMMAVSYHSDLVFMFNDAEGVSQKVNQYALFKKHNTDICPDGTLLMIPLHVLNEWDESKQVSITWIWRNEFSSESSLARQKASPQERLPSRRST